MAIEIRVFDVMTPAGTAIATPLVSSLAFPAREVERIEIVVPTGPNGQLGLRLTTGGQAVIPTINNTWIRASGEIVSLALTGQLQSGAWQLTSYNTGQYNHTVQVRFYLNVVQQLAQPQASTPLPVATLSPLPDAIPAGSPDDTIDLPSLEALQ
jgi:hypothetical protein